MKPILNTLLNIYDKVMVLKLFVDSGEELKNIYVNASNAHNNKISLNPYFIDAGFDLFAPGNEGSELEFFGDSLRFFSTGWSDVKPVNKLDLKVCCSAKMYTDNGKIYNTGYYMHPRSSLSKTQLRLANSTGIIDAGYRGHLIGMFDVVNVDNEEQQVNDIEADYFGNKHDRYLQICAPGLVPILVEIVENKEDLSEETERGDNGFGSTGR
jgi:dUTP pyrophosphatase